MKKPLHIVIIEPFHTGSHAAWTKGIKKHSFHTITTLTMPGIHWKWRMHGGCISMAKKFLGLKKAPDLIIVSDMLDLGGFLALTRHKINHTPIALYFHENQLTYPWSPKDMDPQEQRDRHYAFINYLSALAADYVLFNSDFHMRSFLNALPDFLRAFPDHNEIATVNSIKAKSSVLPLGLDLARFDSFRPNQSNGQHRLPVILWNHRWEYDKNPLSFFDAMLHLNTKGIQFKLAILGKNFTTVPTEIKEALCKLNDNILTCGYAESFQEYAKWLWLADIIPITTIQEYFGMSVMEALYCECVPLLPKRLTYPELIPIDTFPGFFYDNEEDLVPALEKLITSYQATDKTIFRTIAKKYDWNTMITQYDNLFTNLAGKTGKSIDVE